MRGKIINIEKVKPTKLTYMDKVIVTMDNEEKYICYTSLISLKSFINKDIIFEVETYTVNRIEELVMTNIIRTESRNLLRTIVEIKQGKLVTDDKKVYESFLPLETIKKFLNTRVILQVRDQIMNGVKIEEVIAVNK